MNPTHPVRQRSREYIRRTGLPAEYFRFLVGKFGIGIGSRCRVTGFPDESIAEYLHWLGIDVVDDGAPRQEVPPPTFELISGDCEFVIAPMSCSVWESVFDAAPLKLTAERLASLRPGGRVILLPDPKHHARQPAHAPDCFRRQLNEFPGTCEVHTHRRGRVSRLISAFGSVPSGGRFPTISLQTPQNAVSRREWLSIAERAAAGDDAVCCESAAIERRSAELRNAA